MKIHSISKISFMMAIAICSASADLPESRVLTDTNGRKLEAAILSIAPESIRIRRASDAREFDIPLDKLSAADRDWIASRLKPEAEIPPPSPGGDTTDPGPKAPQPLHESGWPVEFFTNLPTADEFLARLEAFETGIRDQEGGLKRYAGLLAERIRAVHEKKPDAWSRLAKVCVRENWKNGNPDGHPDPVVALLLAYSNREDEAHKALATFYSLRNVIPKDYQVPFLRFVHENARKGDTQAIMLMARICLVDTGLDAVNRVQVAQDEGIDLSPEAGMKWVELAMAANIGGHNKYEMERVMAWG